MCGRFTSTTPDVKVIADQFKATFDTDQEYTSSYNIAPSRNILAVHNRQDNRVMERMRWGLVPSWSKGPDSRFSMINARSETLQSKPAFRGLIKKRRCLIPADGYFEWRKENNIKQPYYFRIKSTTLFAFAGLWDSWDGPQGEIQSCTIITTQANEVARPIHDRMPVIIWPGHYNLWLDSGEDTPLKEVLDLLEPYPPNEMIVDKVGLEVNKPSNDFPELVVPIE